MIIYLNILILKLLTINQYKVLNICYSYIVINLYTSSNCKVDISAKIIRNIISIKMVFDSNNIKSRFKF